MRHDMNVRRALKTHDYYLMKYKVIAAVFGLSYFGKIYFEKVYDTFKDNKVKKKNLNLKNELDEFNKVQDDFGKRSLKKTKLKKIMEDLFQIQDFSFL